MKCLIVEDHATARHWLTQVVMETFAGSEVVAVATVKDAMQFLASGIPDIALVDLGLPDGNGRAVIAAIDSLRRSKDREALIVVSSVMNDDASIFNAIRSGADGYLLKEEPRDTLIEMLRGIYEGKPPLSAAIARKLLTHFRPEDEADTPLRPRETQVLQLLAKGFTVRRVAEMLDITPNTASGYVKEIYRKLNVNSRAEATIEASRRGLV
ncbi:MAG: LuxR C-terminal-related transcriptional regulator [Pseudomonadota bacterium]